MAGGSSTALSRDIQMLFDTGTAVGLTDRQLLDRFAGRGDPAADAAFEVLVRRHGPMVLRVCSNALPDRNDAEDAFQATFLVLVRRAGALRGLDSLGGWLYGVACRVAARARVATARRRAVEGRAALRVIEAVETADVDEIDRDEFGPIVQEEVRRLPEKYRAAVVLCYWEGLTQEQAAAQLGCPLGTVRSRLARARELLRRRLTRRGLAPMAVGIGSIRRLPQPAAGLVQSTVRAAVRLAAGHVANPMVSGAMVSLVQGMIGRTTMIKLGGMAAAGIVLVGMAGIGLRVGAKQPSSTEEPRAKQRTGGQPTARERKPAAARSGRANSDVDAVATILRIVPDGTVVKKGDVICTLDSAALADQLINQRITIKSAEANYQNAKLARENAEYDETSYRNDLFPREEREAKGEVDVAERELDVAAGQADVVTRGVGDQGLPFKRAELEIARAKLALEKAKNRLHILTTYTRDKQFRNLVGAMRSARSNELSREATWELEKEKEKKLERQIAACTITAPADGTVVYARPGGLEPGSEVFVHQMPHFLRVFPPPKSPADRR